LSVNKPRARDDAYTTKITASPMIEQILPAKLMEQLEHR
jgi:hypothetical protein